MEMLKTWCLEALRLAVLAAASAAINYVLTLLSGDQIKMSPEIIGIITAVLKGLDRSIHENQDIKAKGILPF